MSSTSRSRREAGQATTEWVAALMIAALLVLGIVATFEHARIERVAASGYCRVMNELGVGGGGSCSDAGGGGGTDTSNPDDDPYDDPWYCSTFGLGCYSPSTEGGDPQPEDEPQPWYCEAFGVGCHDTADQSKVDIPQGLNPDSDLVKTLLSTARGRATLQWLSDNNIPVVLDPNAKGAYWDGTQMVIGKGYEDPSVIVHETNHATATKNGASADASTQNRKDFVTTAINEEVAGTVKQIQAAKEFRAAGHPVGEQPQERIFDQAYGDAKDNGATDAEALDAATKAIAKQFFDGKVKTSNTNEPYTDYYGDFWDSVH